MNKLYCKGCTYVNQQQISIAREEKDVLIVMLCPGDEELNAGYPLASTLPQSASQRVINSLPNGKTINDYAVVELVRCHPGKKNNGKYKQPTKVSVALCYRYLEDLIVKNKYKKIISMCAEGNGIIENILSRNTEIKSILVKGKHPQSGVSNEDLAGFFL